MADLGWAALTLRRDNLSPRVRQNAGRAYLRDLALEVEAMECIYGCKRNGWPEADMAEFRLVEMKLFQSSMDNAEEQDALA